MPTGPAPITGTYEEWITALPQALAPCCHLSMIPAPPAYPTPTPLPTCLWPHTIYLAKLTQPQRSRAGLHGDLAHHPLHLEPLVVGARWTGWEAQAVGPDLAAAQILAAALEGAAVRAVRKQSPAIALPPPP